MGKTMELNIHHIYAAERCGFTTWPKTLRLLTTHKPGKIWEGFINGLCNLMHTASTKMGMIRGWRINQMCATGTSGINDLPSEITHWFCTPLINGIEV